MDFSPENRHLLEKSFKDFCEKPENEGLVEKAQLQEFKQAIKLRDMSSRAEFERQLQDAGEEAMQNLAPFMRNKTLRRVVQTFGNSETTALSEWATNPRVLQMLKQSLALVEEGRMSERELERVMLQQLKDSQNPGFDTFHRAAAAEVILPTDLLASALNEFTSERVKGGTAFRAQQYEVSMRHFSRARAIVNFIRASNPDDQMEVERAKDAENDLALIEGTERADVASLRERMVQLQLVDRQVERKLFGKMFCKS